MENNKESIKKQCCSYDTKVSSVKTKIKNEIEKTLAFRASVPLMKSPRHYYESDLIDLCKEMTELLAIHGSKVGQIHNVMHNLINRGLICNINSNNIVNLMQEIADSVLSCSKNIDHSEIEDIIEEYLMFIGSGLFVSDNGLAMIYSHIATDRGVFEAQGFSCVFRLKTPLLVSGNIIKVIVLVCASSEASLHFAVLKMASVVKTGDKLLIKCMSDEDNEKLFSLLLDLENNIDIYRKIITETADCSID